MRYKKSVIPNEVNQVYHPRSYFSITLPRKKLDLSTFTLYYTGNPSISNYIITFNKNGSVVNFPTYTPAVVGPPAVAEFYAVDNQSRITIMGHGLGSTGIKHVIYNANGGTPIGGLTSGNRYILEIVDANTVRVLPALVSNLYNNTRITLTTNSGTGTQQFLLLDRYYKAMPRNFPRLSSCVVQELIVEIDNKVKQHIIDYNTISAILNDIQKESDDIDSTTFDSLQNVSLESTGYLINKSKILPYARAASAASDVAKYSDVNKKTYFINSWLGFLGEGEKYFDATNKEIKLTFKLAPPNILYKSLPSGDDYEVPHQYSYSDATTYTYATDYELSDIKATIDVLDEIPTIDTFVFRDYKVEQGQYVANNKKCLTSLIIDKPVDWVLGTFKQPDYLTSDTELQLMHCNTNTAKFGQLIKSKLTSIDDINALVPKDLAYSYEISKLNKDPYLLNSSLWFSHSGDGILQCKYLWNNADLTCPMDITTCYNETKKCFSSNFKKVSSILGFESDFFANAVRVDDNSYEYKKIDWEVECDTFKSNSKGGQPFLFCCFVNKL